MSSKGKEKDNQNDQSNKTKGKKEKKAKNTKKKEEIPVVQPKDFNLDTYIARYTGHTKTRRLLFIAQRYIERSGDAYKMALDTMKETGDTSLYRQTFSKVRNQLSPYTADVQWQDRTQKLSNSAYEALEKQLNEYSDNHLRGKMKLAHVEIGHHFFSHGEFPAAFRSYMRAAEHCLTDEDQLELSTNVVRTSVAMSNLVHVPNYVTKAEDNPLLAKNPVLAVEFTIAQALTFLEGNKYNQAAEVFTKVLYEDAKKLNHFISSQDIGIYGALCALASYNRKEMKALLDNSNFQSFVELEPRANEMIRSFHSSNYAQCLSNLEVLKNDLKLDIYLHSHIEDLSGIIRRKALKEYFMPYESGVYSFS